LIYVIKALKQAQGARVSESKLDSVTQLHF